MKESETTELKKSTAELKDAVISIAAILNKHSQGDIYFGIKDNGTIVGQTVGRHTIKEVTQTIVDNIEPKIYPKIEAKKIKGKECVVVEFQGLNSPYFAYGRAYMRVGESDKQLTVKEIEEQIVKRKKFLWESEISKKTLEDVNDAAIQEFMRKAKEAGRINFEFTSTKETLRKLSLLSGDQLTMAAEILFCDNSRMEIQAAVFATAVKATFLDISKFEGNLFSLRKQAEAYVKEHMKWRADMTGSRRKEIPEIPIRALSEAIGNSLCHRDYSNPKGNEVAIFKDRIEIYNPGQFPNELDPDDFIKGDGYSVLRNPLIAETMYRSEDIEKWASGLRRIYDECMTNQVKVEFKRVKTGFVVCFYRPKWENGEGLEQNIQEGKEKSSEKSSEKILRLLKENNTISAQELSGLIGISSRAVEKHLATLKKLNKIKRVGPDKGGHWEAVE